MKKEMTERECIEHDFNVFANRANKANESNCGKSVLQDIFSGASDKLAEMSEEDVMAFLSLIQEQESKKDNLFSRMVYILKEIDRTVELYGAMQMSVDGLLDDVEEYQNGIS